MKPSCVKMVRVYGCAIAFQKEKVQKHVIFLCDKV
jgi:hypothetical protein